MIEPDRYFSSDPVQRATANELFKAISPLPIISPHGHVDPRLFSNPKGAFGSPADLLIIPDHYVTRMLYSQGITLEKLGIPHINKTKGETDHRKIWRIFCKNFHLFLGTPSCIWLSHELGEIFGINEKPSAANADRLFDILSEKLVLPTFAPRKLFERFNIEVLCTTDAATDTLEHHRAIHESGWNGRILPTFRPDGVINLENPGWRADIDRLSDVSRVDIVDFVSYIRALEQRRGFFKAMGATATDHGVLMPAITQETPSQANAIFQRALTGHTTPDDAPRFSSLMLMEMARMSIDDGLVMQLHPGSYRNHNDLVFRRFGSDMGADIPVQTEYTRNLLPLLKKYGNNSRLTLILFSLDESSYSRELAPLVGHYPALKLGPPWWFHDSLNGMARYFDQIMETAGIYNTTGFNDDTRAFCSIPARHDLWRRSCADWVAGLVVRHIVDMDDAYMMMHELVIGLAKRAYKLDNKK